MSPLPDEHPRPRTRGDASQVTLRLDLENGVGDDALRREALFSRIRRFGDFLFASPSLTPRGAASDPFVTLWAVLWACSMLARYEPVRWSKFLDVDRSADATGLEELFRDALDFIPWLLLDTLDTTDAHPHDGRRRHHEAVQRPDARHARWVSSVLPATFGAWLELALT